MFLWTVLLSTMLLSRAFQGRLSRDVRKSVMFVKIRRDWLVKPTPLNSATRFLCTTSHADDISRPPLKHQTSEKTSLIIDDNSSATNKTVKKSARVKTPKFTPVSLMNVDSARTELEWLDQEISRHDKLYYDNDQPEISDSAYDKLIRRAEALEGRFESLRGIVGKLNRVGSGRRNQKFNPFHHTRPMTSLDNAFSLDDVRQFFIKATKSFSTSSTDEDSNKLISNILSDNDGDNEKLVDETLDGASTQSGYPNNLSFSVEPKIDGLSLSLHYYNGSLIRAGTRGDGITGEDVTHNMKFIDDIPLTLKTPASSLIPASTWLQCIEVRGEVYMSKDDFAEANLKRIERNDTPFSNTRNAAAGSLRQLATSVGHEEELVREKNGKKDRKLKFFAYSLLQPSSFPVVVNSTLTSSSSSSTSSSSSSSSQEIIRPELISSPVNSQHQALKLLQEMGFKTAYTSENACRNLEEAITRCSEIQSRRGDFDYDIDGAVIKVDDVNLQRKLGEKTKSPKWAVAYKFPAEEAITELLDITLQVGRTGLITPVANLAPVKVGGVIIERATLHNENEVNRLGLENGCRVVLKRSGDVIPKIVRLADPPPTTSSSSTRNHFKMPSNCPVCGSAVEKDESGILFRCTGRLRCSAQQVESICHFCSRDALDIEGLGAARIEELYHDNIIKSPLDIFKLREMDLQQNNNDNPMSKLREKKGWGDKSVNNLLAAIDNRRSIPFYRFLYALGVRHVGLESSKDIANAFVSFQDLWSYLIHEAQRKNNVSLVNGGSMKDAIKDAMKETRKKVAKKKASKKGKKSTTDLDDNEDTTTIATENSPVNATIDTINDDDIPLGSRLLEMKGIGPKATEALINLAADDEMRRIVDGLLQYLNIEKVNTNTITNTNTNTKKISLASSVSQTSNENEIDDDSEIDNDNGNDNEGDLHSLPLKGETVVFTGRLLSMSRADAQAKTIQCGGMTSARIKTGVTMVVVGVIEGEETGKLRKATESGTIKVINEEEFLKLVGKGNV